MYDPSPFSLPSSNKKIWALSIITALLAASWANLAAINTLSIFGNIGNAGNAGLMESSHNIETFTYPARFGSPVLCGNDFDC